MRPLLQQLASASRSTAVASRSTAVRQMAMLVSKIPPKTLELFLKKYADKDPSKIPPEENKFFVEELIKTLKSDAAGDCSESREFLTIMRRYQDEDHHALLLKGVPLRSDVEAIFFTEIMVSMLNLYRSSGRGFSPVAFVSTTVKDPESYGQIDPHVDQPGGRGVDAFALVGLVSDCKVQTGIIEVENIIKKLSPEVIEILSQPIFKFVVPTDKSEAKKFAILTKGQNGKYLIDFDCDLRGFEFDQSKNKFTKEEAVDSVRRLVRAVYEATTGKEFHDIDIRPGDSLIVKNYRSMHFRGSIPPGATRELVRIYFEGLAGPKEHPSEVASGTEAENVCSPKGRHDEVIDRRG